MCLLWFVVKSWLCTFNLEKYQQSSKLRRNLALFWNVKSKTWNYTDLKRYVSIELAIYIYASKLGGVCGGDLFRSFTLVYFQVTKHTQRRKLYYYRQPCVATRRLCFATVYLFFFLFFIFIQLSFSETTGPILTKSSGIVYSGVVWIIR